MIRNPVQWGVEQLQYAAPQGTFGRALQGTVRDPHALLGAVRRIRAADLRRALAAGIEDFAANRSDVVFLCIAYPVIGLVLGRMVAGTDLLPLLFPLASGFALIGPLAGVGLYEMSRRREQGLDVSWADAFGVVRSPSFGAIALLGLLLAAIFVLWLMVAYAIYELTLGPVPPATAGAFLRDVLTTGPGWAMIVLGIGIGFLFAVLVLAISVVSFPLLLDRKVGFDAAVRVSMRAVAMNPGPMALWGVIVAAGLVLGSIPFFLGLVVVLPVLGHATWHLYRAVLPR
jgi:uncharacterized membrane protein